MGQQPPSHASASSPIGERLEAFVREHLQRCIHALVAEEITARLGRPTSARRGAAETPPGLRHGYGKARRLSLTSGTITVRRPRGRWRGERLVRRALPVLQRRPRQGGAWLPPLSWQGLALGDFARARRGLLGAGAPLSAPSRARLQASWPMDYAAWQPRRLEDLEVVDVWAEGRAVKAGLEASTAALLVRSGALPDGQTVGLAVESGQREAHAAWGAVRRDRRPRGLQPWRWTIADGHRGSWAALAARQPTAAEPRGWHPRSTHVVDVIPPQQQAQARPLLCARPPAANHAACAPLRTPCETRSRQLAPRAVERLAHAWARVVPFDQGPRGHWRHLRTTPVVESPVATARRRTGAATRFKKVDSATALMGKLRQVAERTCRRGNVPERLPAVDAGAE